MTMIRFSATIGMTLLCIGVCCPDALQAFDSENWRDNVQWHGFASQGYLSSDLNNYYAETENGSFEFNEFGLTVLADPINRVTVGMQFLSRDLGVIGNNEIAIDWAYGTYRWRDWFAISAGQLKFPWGLYNETRDIDLLRTWIFLPTSLYDEQFRDVYSSYTGVSVGGDLFSERFGDIAYSAGYGEKILSEASSAYLMSLSEDVFQDVYAEAEEMLIAQLDWDTPISGLRLASTFGKFPVYFSADANSNPVWLENNILPGTLLLESASDQTSVILSAEYTRNKVTVAAEYLKERAYNQVVHSYYTGIQMADHDEYSEGYYVSLAYRLTRWLQCGAYYSVHYPNTNDKDGKQLAEAGEPAHGAWQKEVVLTARIDLNEHWLLKFEGHAIDGTADVPEYANPDGLNEHSFLFAIKTTFSF